MTPITAVQGGFRQKLRSKPRSSDDVSSDQTFSDREDLHTSHKTTFTRLSWPTKRPNKIREGDAFFKLRLQLSGLTHLFHQNQAFDSWCRHKGVRHWLGRKSYFTHFNCCSFFLQITSGPDPDCISFGAKQINPMGLVQPANAILYDFYNPGKGAEKLYITDWKRDPQEQPPIYGKVVLMLFVEPYDFVMC